MASGKYVRIAIGYLFRTVSSSACVSSGSRPVSNVNTSMRRALLAIASSTTISSAPKLHAKAVGDWVRSIRLRFSINSRVLPARSITTLTSNHAGDTHHEKDASKNAAHHHLRQPAADGASNVNSRSRTQQQTDEKAIIDISELQMPKTCNGHERDRMGEVGADDLRSAQLRIEQHEGSNADGPGSNRSQRHHDSQNHPNKHGETVGCPFAQFEQLPPSRYDAFPQKDRASGHDQRNSQQREQDCVHRFPVSL